MLIKTLPADRIRVDDSSWIDNDDDNEVRTYTVDYNPLQLKTELPSGNNDRFQVYFYKSQHTYIGTLVVRYKVSFFYKNSVFNLGRS